MRVSELSCQLAYPGEQLSVCVDTGENDTSGQDLNISGKWRESSHVRGRIWIAVIRDRVLRLRRVPIATNIARFALQLSLVLDHRPLLDGRLCSPSSMFIPRGLCHPHAGLDYGNDVRVRYNIIDSSQRGETHTSESTTLTGAALGYTCWFAD